MFLSRIKWTVNDNFREETNPDFDAFSINTFTSIASSKRLLNRDKGHLNNSGFIKIKLYPENFKK